MGPGNDKAFTLLAFLALGGMVIYRLVLWLIEAPRTADPWDKEIDEALDKEEAVPVCHHCFTPQEQTGWFCPECGAIVGPYCNYMPYLYVFSQGEVLRAGVVEHIRGRPLIIIGYIVFSLGMFSIAGPVLLAVGVPIYLFSFFKNLRRRDYATLDEDAEDRAKTPNVTTPMRGDIETFKQCPWCGKEYSDEAAICPTDGNQLVSKARAREQ